MTAMFTAAKPHRPRRGNRGQLSEGNRPPPSWRATGVALAGYHRRCGERRRARSGGL